MVGDRKNKIKDFKENKEEKWAILVDTGYIAIVGKNQLSCCAIYNSKEAAEKIIEKTSNITIKEIKPRIVKCSISYKKL